LTCTCRRIRCSKLEKVVPFLMILFGEKLERKVHLLILVFFDEYSDGTLSGKTAGVPVLYYVCDYPSFEGGKDLKVERLLFAFNCPSR